jgi:DNA-binding CsgD family transcriptional regulator/tetratricopeptide (TPR) repeat protein
VDLLERGEQVAAAVERYGQLDRHGHLLVVSGEAGAGKTALVQELLDHHLADAQVLVGRCDDLFAPRPLGPLADIARGRPGPLADALAAGDPPAVFDAFLAEVAAPPHQTVVVLEDLQWADEATLDLLRFVARRLDSLPCLLLVTHRDDLAPDHPMRRTLGSLVGPHVSRLHLAPLSLDAVTTLVGDRPLDPAALHASTGGNPFFLVETIDAEAGSLPASVREVILSRTIPLSGSARDALDAAAVLGRAVTAELIEAVGDCDAAAVDECLRAGLLVDIDGEQVFRHDLTRQTVEETMTPLRRRQLHARALDALGPDGDVVQRAHHAIGAGDRTAIVELAWQAADHCVALNAWRQAALLYGQALDHAGDDLPEADLDRLLDATATTCMRVEFVDDAVTIGERLFARYAAVGDLEMMSHWQAWLSRGLRAVGRAEEATRAAEEAVTRVAHLTSSPILAEATSLLSGHQLVTGRYEECIETSRRAIKLCTVLDVEDAAIYALNSYGAALGSLGRDGAVEALRESIDRAKRAGFNEAVARGAANLSYTLISGYRIHEAVPVYDDGIEVCEEHELHFALNCLRPGRAEALIYLGDWDTAAADLSAVLIDPYASTINRGIVLCNLGRLRSRRGDPGAAEALDESIEIFRAYDEAQLFVPTSLTRAELAWLGGDLAGATAHVEATIDLASMLDRWVTRELVLWTTRTGIAWSPSGELDEPTSLTAARDWRGLAAFWGARGCPYETADALVDSDDADDVRRAHEMLTALGARPRAQMAARRLRDLGVRDVPRGPRASTRANPAGLTARELEVASLLAEGLTNAEIADRLIVSAKTVDHHVSAVLTKLGVTSRRRVGAAAEDLGVDLATPIAGR